MEFKSSLFKSEIGFLCQTGMVQTEKGRRKGEMLLVPLVCGSSFGELS